MTSNEKVVNFLKDNVLNIVLVILCLAYILKGLTEIEPTGKTVGEVIANGVLAFVVGLMIKYIYRQKGFIAGFDSEKFVSTCNAYGEKIISISPFIQDLDSFCDYLNKAKLKEYQTSYLISKGLSYNKFINGDYDISADKLQRKWSKKARRIKPYKYTSITFTNAYDGGSGGEKKLLGAKKSKFNAHATSDNVVYGILFSFIFAYYTLSNFELSVDNLIWGTLQIVMFISFGLLEHMKAYEFVTEKYRAKIKRVMVLLDEFINLRTINPKIFEKEEYIKNE